MEYKITDSLIVKAQEACPWHPIANVFPLADEDDFAVICVSIQDVGQIEPVRTWRGQVVDGRNRQLACLAIGRDPAYEEDDSPNEEKLVERFWSVNIARRHLRPSQKAMAAAELRAATEGMTTKAAAKVTGASERNARRANNVIENGSPLLVAACRSGEVCVEDAERILELSHEEQDRRVKALREGKISNVSRSIVNEDDGPEGAWLAAEQKPYDKAIDRIGKMLEEFSKIKDTPQGKYLPYNALSHKLNTAAEEIAMARPYKFAGGSAPPDEFPAGFVTESQYQNPQTRESLRRLGYDQ